jgi:Fe-S-cluster containining protein
MKDTPVYRIDSVEGYVNEFLKFWTDSNTGDDYLEASVPCQTCTACCWHPGVFVEPDVETSEALAAMTLKTDSHDRLYIPKRADGGCVHLNERGCGIYEHRPRVCREFDCRVTALSGVTYTPDEMQVPWWEFSLKTEAEVLFVTMAFQFGQWLLQGPLSATLGSVEVATSGAILWAASCLPVMLRMFDRQTEQEQRALLARLRREFNELQQKRKRVIVHGASKRGVKGLKNLGALTALLSDDEELEFVKIQTKVLSDLIKSADQTPELDDEHPWVEAAQ